MKTSACCCSRAGLLAAGFRIILATVLSAVGASCGTAAAGTETEPADSKAKPAGTDERTVPLESGPEAGSSIQSFFVRAVTGPHRNRSVCYVCRYGSRPVVAVFIQKVDPQLPRLLQAIDRFVDDNRLSGLRSFGVLVTDQSSSVVPILQTMAFDGRIRMPLTASTTAIAGSSSWRLDKRAATTIVTYRKQKSVGTLAYADGAIDDAAVKRTLQALRTLIRDDR